MPFIRSLPNVFKKFQKISKNFKRIGDPYVTILGKTMLHVYVHAQRMQCVYNSLHPCKTRRMYLITCMKCTHNTYIHQSDFSFFFIGDSLATRMAWHEMHVRVMHVCVMRLHEMHFVALRVSV